MEVEYQIPTFGSNENIVVTGEAHPDRWYQERGEVYPRGEHGVRMEKVGWSNGQDMPKGSRGL